MGCVGERKHLRRWLYKSLVSSIINESAKPPHTLRICGTEALVPAVHGVELDLCVSCGRGGGDVVGRLLPVPKHWYRRLPMWGWLFVFASFLVAIAAMCMNIYVVCLNTAAVVLCHDEPVRMLEELVLAR